MNGEPLPFLHGGPLRLVVPGWPGSLSQKWLTRIWIRDREHDGPGMTGLSYRIPVRPLPPGGDAEGEALRILESMPVRSIVSHPADGAALPAGTRRSQVRGAAWAGDTGWPGGRDHRRRRDVDRSRADAAPQSLRLDALELSVALPGDGSYEIHCPRHRLAGAARSHSAPRTGIRMATAATSCTGWRVTVGPEA